MKNKEKIQKFIIISIVLFAILVITFTSSLIKQSADIDTPMENPSEAESTSTQMGKSTEEAEKELSSETQFDIAELVPNDEERKTLPITDSSSKEIQNTQSENKVEPTTTMPDKENAQEDLVSTEVTFTAPVKGSILREFARESLVYSDTLKEWIIHNGVDIKADKTSVVSSSADGKIFAIKNDPRYGLTVVIDHANGFQTIYSNLLTTEFVVEGETVSAGQSIGTVGNTASFEILDDCHLHFELLQNNEYLDPTIYINFED